MTTIIDIRAREILDSRGNPTVEVDVVTEGGGFGRAAVPSGASTGEFEAHELRDGEEDRYGGMGVRNAVANVNTEIAEALIGYDAGDQVLIDEHLIALDGTEDKRRLGANAILGASLACSCAAADFYAMPLYRYLGGVTARYLPVPMFNILNGGVHTVNNVDIQEFMVMPFGAPTFREALRAGSEVYHSLKNVLIDRGFRAGVGDEGGFVPNLKSNVQAIELILEAIEKAGYVPGENVVLCIDAAASELYRNGKYILEAEGKEFDSDGMIEFYTEWVDKYPIVSIEDGLDEEDWEGWSAMTEALGNRIQIVGDDIFATNPVRIARGIEEKAANSVLIKLNQIGTVTETLDAIRTTHLTGYSCVISHRSGETGDTYISDFAVATRGNQIKAGAPARSERVIKYNRLIKIEDELGGAAVYEGARVLKPVSL